ncbi:DUF397 domain-containing protein [Kitasatospora sp. NPDC057223]|uniref:DUF397 domain-containing protein n=1 Tax=Kitasatospora sp. NPDC057223 TaxID=3346055 RepID=UPI003640A7D6
MTYHPVASVLPVQWRKAKASNPNENCVEAGALGDAIAFRDSKDPHGPAHSHAPAAFGAFATAVGNDTLVPVA